MLATIDYALTKTNEQNVKTRAVCQADCEDELIEKFNNGFIDIPRLELMSKMVQDAVYELLRQHTFKIEAIERSEFLKKIVDSVVEHRERGRPCAIYNDKKQPHFNEDKILSKFCNRLEYFWRVHMTPILFICTAAIFCLLTLVVGFLEMSLYLSFEDSNLY